MSRHVVYGLLNGGDLLGFVIRDLALELFFESHHQFHRVKRIGPQIIDKRRFILDVRLIDTKLFRDEADVRQLIKMKGIYELLESVTDRAEDVANIIEGIILENS